MRRPRLASLLPVGLIIALLASSCGGATMVGSVTEGQSQAQPTEATQSVIETDAPEPPFIRLAHHRLCGVTADRRLWCMGRNSFGQLGDGTTLARTLPTFTEHLGSVSDVALGRSHTCALTSGGEVACWGDNSLGQLGDGTLRFRLRPVKVHGLTGVREIVATASSTIARLADGSLFCWGMPCLKDTKLPPDVVSFDPEEQGCVGAVRELCSLAPQKLAQPLMASQMASGESHLCGVQDSGEVLCLGANDAYQLGRDSPRFPSEPLKVPDIDDARQVEVFGDQTCALEASGQVRCWGPEDADDPPGYDDAKVRLVTTIAGARKIAWTDHLLCGLTNGAGVSCVASRAGLLQRVGEEGPLEAEALPDVSDVVDIGIDKTTACALRGDGSLLCAGLLPSAPSGDDDDYLTWTPVTVPGLSKVSSVSAGLDMNCAVLSNGTVACFGRWVFRDVTGPMRVEAVPGLTDVVEVDAGYHHACARTRDGRVWCWSYRSLYPGEPPRFGPILGNGERVGSFEPVEVSGLTEVEQVALTVWHTCAVRRDGTLWCWGVNGNGQLGDGTLDARSSPTQVTSLSDVVEVATGLYSTCARLSDGQVLCWGFMGCDCDAGANEQTDPLIVKGIPPAVSLSFSARVPCITTKQGEGYCWNYHVYGDDFSPSGARGEEGRRPFRVPITETLQQVAPSNAHVCALLATGEVKCFGRRDDFGETPRQGLFVIPPPNGS